MTEADTSPARNGSGEQFQRQRRFARQCIIQTLYQSDTADDWDWPEKKAEAFWLQTRELEENPQEKISKKTRQFIWETLREIIDHRENLDQILQEAASNWSLKRMSAIDRNILRLAAYEIIHRPDIPRGVSINEAVELAKQFGDKDSPRFINGVLDALKELR